MRVTHNKFTGREPAIGGVSSAERASDGHLWMVAMTPAVVRLAQVARAIHRAHLERNGDALPARGKSRA